MKNLIAGISLAVAAASLPAVPAYAKAKAKGTPQRSAKAPPGLAKLILDPNSGIMRALVATQGSNSRLQDLPVSP